MTVDGTVLGRRLNEYRNRFGIPEGLGYPNICPDADMTNLVDQGDDLAYGELLRVLPLAFVMHSYITSQRMASTGRRLSVGFGASPSSISSSREVSN